jgi:hypothetical protein
LTLSRPLVYRGIREKERNYKGHPVQASFAFFDAVEKT